LEDWVTIKNLKKRNSKLGTRQIAGLLGISRNTVKKALKKNETPGYKRQKEINPKMLPFKEYIFERLILKKLNGSCVLDEIISKGYTGSKSSFYRYIANLKAPEVKTFQPYETQPGEQAQYDWSEYTVKIAEQLTKVYVFSCILGFSRYRVYQASLSQTQGSVFEALENSLISFGGVTERIQTDNAKCFIINASKNNLQWNPRYLAFCGHYGFEPSRSLPAHPWSKGKVEKPFDYLEEHFIKAKEFSSFDDFLNKLKIFNDEVNNRIHTTTKQTPLSLFEKEKQSLTALPEGRYVDIKEQVRKVTADCLVSFSGSRYSVPHQFALREVWLKVSKGYLLEIYSSQNILIAQHKLSLIKGKSVINLEHYKNHRTEKGSWNRLCEMFLISFPEQNWFLDKLKTQKRINPAYHLTQILELTKFYFKDDCIKAYDEAKRYNIYTHIFIKGYLENNFTVQPVQPGIINHISLNKITSSKYDIKRPLEQYKLAYQRQDNLTGNNIERDSPV
jgi:transposase